MKAILEFYLPDDEEEYNNAKNGAAYYALLNNFVSSIRDIRKYKPPKSKEAGDLLEKLWTELFDLAKHFGVTIW